MYCAHRTFTLYCYRTWCTWFCIMHSLVYDYFLNSPGTGIPFRGRTPNKHCRLTSPIGDFKLGYFQFQVRLMYTKLRYRANNCDVCSVKEATTATFDCSLSQQRRNFRTTDSVFTFASNVAYCLQSESSSHTTR